MTGFIKTVFHAPKSLNFYHIPDIFSEPFEVKDEPFSGAKDPFELYIVVSNEAKGNKDQNIVYWSPEESVLTLISRYLYTASEMEKDLWERVKRDLDRLCRELEGFESKDSKIGKDNLNQLYLFYNDLLMYDGGQDPFDYFFKQEIEKQEKKNKQSLIVLNEFSSDPSFQEVIVSEKNLLLFSLKYSLYLKDLAEMKKKKTLKEALKLLDEFFNEIDMPVVVYNKFNDLVVYNKSFRALELLSEEVLTLRNGGSIEQSGMLYEVHRKEFDFEGSQYTLFYFQEGEEESQNALQIEEMGVVTSSIAHELNNPIGGILAGSEVLLTLPLGLSELEKDILTEIKKSALKCRSLIKIFLGFARAEMNFNMEARNAESIEQALSLLRTRFVELGFKIDVDINIKSIYQIENLSLWTMIYYTFLTAILNSVSRSNLISDKKGEEIRVSALIDEQIVSFQILNHEIDDILLELNQSSFFHQLLNFANVSFFRKESSFYFTKK